MEQDIFLKLSGIQGESQDAVHMNEIQVLEWEWLIEQDSAVHRNSGGGAGKATVNDLIFEHYMDKASPTLMKYCLTGRHIPEAVLVARKAGGTSLEYYKLTLSDVVITRVRTAMPAGTPARQQVSLSFAKVQEEYTVQNEHGGKGGTVQANFDIKANQSM